VPTDATGTSRIPYVATEALLAFAHAVIQHLTGAGRRQGTEAL